MARSKSSGPETHRKQADHQGTISVQSLVLNCREWRSKVLRKLEVTIGISPQSLTYRQLEFIICIRKFWLRARFPDGEVFIIRPPLATIAPIGNVTIGTTTGRERQVGGTAEISSTLKAIFSVQEKRSRQDALSFTAPLTVVEQFKGVLPADRQVATWRVVLIDPARLSAAKHVPPAAVTDDYIQNLEVEAHAQWGVREEPTTVALELDRSSYFILSPRRSERWGRFVDSLRFITLRGTKRGEELIAAAAEATGACELLPVKGARA